MEPVISTGTETKKVIPVPQQGVQSLVVIMNSDKSRILRTLTLKEAAVSINNNIIQPQTQLGIMNS